MLHQIVQSNQLTMSSLDFLVEVINPAREQAGETPHEPRKFLAKVEDELDLNATGKKFRLNNNQTESAYYDLDMDQLMLVGMRESKQVRLKVLSYIKRHQPATPALPNFADPVAAARAWADAVEQKQAAEQQLALAAPKVEFVDKYVTSSGNIGFRQLAKLLKVKEPELRTFLFDQKIMYRLGGTLTPFQNHIDAGRFEVKAGVADHGDTNHAYSQAKITPKGVEWLAGEWGKHQARQAVAANDNQGGAA